MSKAGVSPTHFEPPPANPFLEILQVASLTSGLKRPSKIRRNRNGTQPATKSKPALPPNSSPMQPWSTRKAGRGCSSTRPSTQLEERVVRDLLARRQASRRPLRPMSFAK